MTPSLDRRAVSLGAGAAVVVYGATRALAAVLSSGDEGNRSWPLVAITFGSFVLAGGIAGWLRSDRPMVNGAASAALASAVVLVIGLVQLRGDDERLRVAVVMLAVLLAVSCGAGGGLAADWLRRRLTRARSHEALGAP